MVPCFLLRMRHRQLPGRNMDAEEVSGSGISNIADGIARDARANTSENTRVGCAIGSVANFTQTMTSGDGPPLKEPALYDRQCGLSILCCKSMFINNPLESKSTGNR